MKLSKNINLQKDNIINRLSAYKIDEYSVVDVESGDRIKFIAGGFLVTIESSNAQEWFLICLMECFWMDGISLVEEDANKILDRIEYILDNGI